MLRYRSILAVVVVVVGGVGGVACSPASPEPGPDDAADQASDRDELQKLLDAAVKDDRLTLAEVDDISATAVAQPLRRETIVTLKEFYEQLFDSPLDEMEPVFDNVGTPLSSADAGMDLVQLLYFGLPHDLVKPTGVNQRVRLRLHLEAVNTFNTKHDGPELTVKLERVAAKDYTLSFRILEHEISVDIPGGATAAEAAGLVAEAINAEADAIVESDGDDDRLQFAEGGANFDLDFLSFIEATTDNSTVAIEISTDA